MLGEERIAKIERNLDIFYSRIQASKKKASHHAEQEASEGGDDTEIRTFLLRKHGQN